VEKLQGLKAFSNNAAFKNKNASFLINIINVK